MSNFNFMMIFNSNIMPVNMALCAHIKEMESMHFGHTAVCCTTRSFKHCC